MKIEKIDKWLDDKYGISYTELVKIKEYLSEENERLKLDKNTKSASEIICENLHDVYKSRIEKAIPMLKELNIKMKSILNIGIDIKEISDIEDTLNGRSDE